MEAQILITEIETDNIIFVNEKMREAFGLPRDIRGEKCWKHFQTHCNKRCDFCPKDKPEFYTGEPIVWEERNSRTGRHYRVICRMIDWDNGTKVYFQQRDDITELVDTATKLNEYFQQQELILEAMEAQILITDIETDNIIFVNEKMREAFGLVRDIRGEKCWKHFQTHCNKRCDFCPKDKPEFRAGKPILWEERNSCTGKHYRVICRMIDWNNGAKVYFQQRDDITELVDTAAKLNEHLQQQMLMTSVVHRFLTEEDAELLFTNVLSEVGEFMGISQVLLYQLEDNGTTLICRNEWFNPVLRLETCVGHKLELKEEALSVVHHLSPNRNNDLCLRSTDPSFGSMLKPYRTRFHNYIITPIFVKGKMCAILDFAMKESHWEWSDKNINLAVLVAGVFSGVFERNAMERQFSMVENSPNFLLYLSPNGDV